MVVVGEWSFIELNLFDLRKTACLVEDIGVQHDGEWNQNRGWMATNPGRGEGRAIWHLRHQGVGLGILTDGRIRVDQEDRVAIELLGEVGNQMQCVSI